jgi:hypothetical protein
MFGVAAGDLKPEIRNPEPGTKSPKPETRNLESGTRNTKPTIRNAKPEIRPDDAAGDEPGAFNLRNHLRNPRHPACRGTGTPVMKRGHA